MEILQKNPNFIFHMATVPPPPAVQQPSAYFQGPVPNC